MSSVFVLLSVFTRCWLIKRRAAARQGMAVVANKEVSRSLAQLTEGGARTPKRQADSFVWQRVEQAELVCREAATAFIA